MPQHTSKWRNHFLKTFHTPKTSKNANLRPAQEGSSTSSHAIQTTQLENASIPQDLWQAAYDQLEEKEQAILSKIQVPNPPNKDDTNYSQTKVVIDKVIQMTKEQYEEYQRGGLKIRQSTGEDINIRKISQQIISAALSFKDIVSAVAAFDPTNHAASTWAVVLLGLTITKNRQDLRDALLKSSEYLADVLARCAYIEKNFYHKGSGIDSKIRSPIIRVYKAILYYTAEVMTAQKPGMGRRVLDSVTTIANQPLTTLQSSVKEEEQYLYQWVQLDQHLHRKEEAERLLAQIDKVEASVLNLIQNFNFLNLHIAEGAFYDSYLNQHEDMCLPDTRTDLRYQIAEWAESSDGKCIFWLNGMAGTGKSTIARTVAQSFKEKGQLGASFFFKRGEVDRGNAKRFISTIARQLVTNHRQLVPGVLKAIENDPNISAKSLKEQFDKLLLQPLLNLNPSQITTTVIVIDALDECEQEYDIRVILQFLPQLQKSNAMRVRIFLTSRPELPIRFGFQQHNEHQDLILHELPTPVIEHDIRLFLKDRILKIRNERLISSDWPGNEAIEKLVAMAVPLFIFAATICRFIGDRRFRPEKRLAAVLQDQAVTSASRMDRTYLPVLNQILADENENESEIKQLLQEFQDTVGVIILLAAPLSATALAQLINMPDGDISNRLDAFHSVLSIPEDINAPVRILHLSFRDFLVNTRTVFHVDEEEIHRKIAYHCIRIMNIYLKHNICGLPSYGIQRADINSQAVSQYLTAELRYTCRYWAHHLEKSKILDNNYILTFLENHFLHWLEAMSLMGYISEVVGIINTVLFNIKNNSDSKILEFLHDAKRFVLKNLQICNTAPLQLYCSGLIFSPRMSTIRRGFTKEIPRWIYLVPQMEDKWHADLQTLGGHSGSVISMAFSPDGQILASGSNDGTVRLWDVKTCTEQHILLHIFEDHKYSVRAVAFSPDGQILASGSDDGTVKLWDVKTCTEQHMLKQIFRDHKYSVRAVAFSPDCQTLASGSDNGIVKLWDIKTRMERNTFDHQYSVQTMAFSLDGQTLALGFENNTVKLWDIKTCTEQHTLKGHLGSVETVAFSPDGQTLASGSKDETVKLWDVTTYTEKYTLKCHSLLLTVAFSPDGQTLASGSNDTTIKLWDTKTGMEQHTLKGHLGWVVTVVFSPDGHTLASGSNDKTVKLWDITTHTEQHILKGHLYSVKTMVFSPDSQILASGSYDDTIKLWDVKTSTEKYTLKGHLRWVQTVAFSPDSQTLASGSEDGIVKLWNAKTGMEQHTLKSHLDCIQTLAFSPDSQILASGSNDTTIKLWDTKTGMEQHTLKGHLGWVVTVAFLPDGQTLASGSEDCTVKLWDVKTGTIYRTIPTEEPISRLSFSKQDRYLDTNLGPLDIQYQGDSYPQTSYHPTPQASLVNEWVVFNGEKVLWLPFEYRQPNCLAIKDGILALGLYYGQVYIIGFSTPIRGPG